MLEQAVEDARLDLVVDLEQADVRRVLELVAREPGLRGDDLVGQLHHRLLPLGQRGEFGQRAPTVRQLRECGVGGLQVEQAQLGFVVGVHGFDFTRCGLNSTRGRAGSRDR